MLRNDLIHLASTFPQGSDERRQLLDVLAARDEADPSQNMELASKAIKALLKSAGVKAQVDARKTSAKVPVPSGFESLFKSIEFEVLWGRDKRWARIGWSYAHPGSLGSNGLTIGVIGFDNDVGKWHWRNDISRERGVID